MKRMNGEYNVTKKVKKSKKKKVTGCFPRCSYVIMVLYPKKRKKNQANIDP